jgi:hypothetical protein
MMPGDRSLKIHNFCSGSFLQNVKQHGDCMQSFFVDDITNESLELLTVVVVVCNIFKNASIEIITLAGI